LAHNFVDITTEWEKHMTKEIEMTEEEAEQIIQPIFDWLAGGAHGTGINEKHCLGTIPQDLALSFAQELLESVGIDAAMITGMANNLAPDDLASDNHVVVPFIKETIH
jgi:hypothetical protein